MWITIKKQHEKCSKKLWFNHSNHSLVPHTYWAAFTEANVTEAKYYVNYLIKWLTNFNKFTPQKFRNFNSVE